MYFEIGGLRKRLQKAIEIQAIIKGFLSPTIANR